MIKKNINAQYLKKIKNKLESTYVCIIYNVF